jgi:hypothetical protein
MLVRQVGSSRWTFDSRFADVDGVGVPHGSGGSGSREADAKRVIHDRPEEEPDGSLDRTSTLPILGIERIDTGDADPILGRAGRAEEARCGRARREDDPPPRSPRWPPTRG